MFASDFFFLTGRELRAVYKSASTFTRHGVLKLLMEMLSETFQTYFSTLCSFM